MMEFKSKVQELAYLYEDELAKRGIKIIVSKKYFETDVDDKFYGGTFRTALFSEMSRASYRRREKSKGYNYQPNRYHMIILTLSPLEKKLLKKSDCRDYAFTVKKIERPHVGEEPRKKRYKEEKVLGKIEKRIKKIIEKSEGSTPVKACKNSIMDVIRYTFSSKYEYKEEYFGKDKYFWDILLMVILGVLAILVIAIPALIFS